MDDILIYSKSREEHGHHLHMALQTLENTSYMPNWRNVTLVGGNSIFGAHGFSRGYLSGSKKS